MVSGVVCTVRVVVPVMPLSVAEMVVVPALNGGGEAGAIDGGNARVGGGPRHLAGYVLRAAVGVRSRWR